MIPDLTVVEKVLFLKLSFVVMAVVGFWIRLIRPLMKEKESLVKWRTEVNGKIDRLEEKMTHAEKDHAEVRACMRAMKDDVVQIKILLARIEERINTGKH